MRGVTRNRFLIKNERSAFNERSAGQYFLTFCNCRNVLLFPTH